MIKSLWQKYPKLVLLVVIYTVTIIFSHRYFSHTDLSPNSSNKLWEIFLSGGFYAYGFTAAPATAALLILSRGQNIVIAGLVGGLGALISDILIFLFIRQSFMTEISLIKRESIIRILAKKIAQIMGKLAKYFLPILACLFIASPLPTEIGVTLLASLKSFSLKKFALIAFGLHTLGIFMILYLGQQI